MFEAIFSAFVNPWLLGGLALASLPVVIHLLNKRRFEVHPWAAMEFLLQAQVMNRRRLRLEDLILLLLRIAVICLLVFAIARPLLRGGSGWREDRRIVVVDDSGSMQAAGALGSAWDSAREAAEGQIQDAFGASIPVELRWGARPERDPARADGRVRGGYLTETGVAGDPNDPARIATEAGYALLEGLRGERAVDTPLRFGRVLEHLIEDATSDSAPELRSVVLLTDLRRRDWLASDGSLDPEVAYALEEIERREWEGRFRLQLIDSGSPIEDNLSVADFRIDAPRLVAGLEVRLSVEIANHGDTEKAGVSGGIEIGEPGEREFVLARRLALPAVPVIPPGETRTVEVPHVFERPGEWPLRVRIDADGLNRDDESWLVARVQEGIRVTVFDAKAPGARRFERASGFLEVALSPRGDEATGVVVSVESGEIGPSSLAETDVAIIVDRPSLSALERETLAAFAEKGGGLAWFLGDGVSAAAWAGGFGVKRGDEELRLVPARVGEARDAPGRKRNRLVIESKDHAMFGVFRGTEGLSLDRPLFFRALDCEVAPGGVVLVRYDDSERTPAIIEGRVGAGRVLLFNTTADRGWSDWPTDITYPVALQEAVRWLTPALSRRALDAGDAIVWPVRPGMAYDVIGPDGEAHAVPAPEGAALLTRSYEDTHTAGWYRVVERPVAGDGEEKVSWYACRFAARESDLERVSEAELAEELAEFGVPVSVGSGVDVDETRREREGETWRWLALACGAFLLLELFTAWWFGRR